jgi:hypothetical protein
MAKVKKPKLPRTWSGKVLTDEIAEQLADEVESADVVKWRRRRPVGPPPADEKCVAPRVSLRIPTDLHEAIKAQANEKRRTVSDLTREALEKLLVET